MAHVDLGAQDVCARCSLATVHELKQAQVLLHRTVAERTVGARTGGGAFLLCDDLCALFVDIGTALLDEPHGKVPEFLEVVAGVIDIRPFESEPLDVVLDVLDVFGVLLDGVGVVEAQVADAAIALSDAEVHGNGFGMTDMKVAVGLRRESCLQSSAVLAFRQVFLYLLFYEVETSFLNVHALFCCCHIIFLN